MDTQTGADKQSLDEKASRNFPSITVALSVSESCSGVVCPFRQSISSHCVFHDAKSPPKHKHTHKIARTKFHRQTHKAQQGQPPSIVAVVVEIDKHRQ